MRAIFLNAWYGKAGKAFFEFISQESSKTDIFCFQEISPELFSELSEILKEFKGIIATDNKKELLGHIYLQVVFVRKGVEVLSSGKIDLYRQVTDDVGFLQHLELKRMGEVFYIGNVHGKARPGHKLDTPARISQSKKIINFFKNKKGGIIIGGDFNLMPETRSVKLFEKAGYKNLIKEFQVKTTRNKLAWDQFQNTTGFERQYFADFCFVLGKIKIKAFNVPRVEVSDHLPLVLDFNL